MATHAGAIEAMQRARQHLPEVVRTYMRVLGISQEHLGAALGMTQRQVSRRLTVPGSLSGDEVAALASFFGVSIDSLFKPVPEAITDLLSPRAASFRAEAGDAAAGPREVGAAADTDRVAARKRLLLKTALAQVATWWLRVQRTAGAGWSDPIVIAS